MKGALSEMIAFVLMAIVALVSLAARRPALAPLFRWLPTPLWCYALPLLGVSLGCLPPRDPTYRVVTDHALPFALALLLLGLDVRVVARAGRSAVMAAAIGAAGILIAAPAWVWLLRNQLPPEAWKGAGALAATWTGGTMNLLAIRSVLHTPDAIFAPLILVDAVMAYSWMALLVAASGAQQPIDRWLRAAAPQGHGLGEPAHQRHAPQGRLRPLILCAAGAALLTAGAQLMASRLPTSSFVTSASGWTVLLVTTAAMGLALIPWVRRLGFHGDRLGSVALLLVLAATGAQADLAALRSAPAWLLVGCATVATHAACLLAAGRWLRLPVGMLATASQANVGGVISAPLVGAVYHHSLVPVGLLLAMAGNALGTYAGLLAAGLCRWLVGG
jgi:uncharacterized membrane protein